MKQLYGAGALLVLLSAGCVGEISDLGGDTFGSGDPQSGELGVAHVPLRRLTREEYNNSVRDLLGDTTRPADAFPPDETSAGFESNNLAPVTGLAVQRYLDAAEAVAAKARERFDTLAPCAAGQHHLLCAQRFVDQFGRLAFRRPLDDGERSALISLYSDKQARSDYAGAIQVVLEAILQSPQFLYRIESGDGQAGSSRALTGYELATRLAFFLWQSTPDDALLDAVAAGKLDSLEGLEGQARRLLDDPRSTDAIRSFHRQWLDLRQLETLQKESALFPAFSPELADAMAEETLRFSLYAVTSGGDSIEKLLTSHESFVDPLLASLYGVSAPSSGFALVELPAGQRSGVLTHASVLSVHAKAEQTSPILRGKFVRERLLCQAIPPPPPDANITPPQIDPTLSTKDRFLQHQTDESCKSCHQLMDPIGFGFEHYDAIGAWRTMDGIHPVDAVGEISQTDDANGSFDGALELGARLAGSEQVRRCIAAQWLRFALGRGERDEEQPSLEQTYATFEREGFDVRELLVAIVKSPAFRYARIEGGTP